MINLIRDFKISDFILINFVNLNKEERELVRSWRNHEAIRKWMYHDHIIPSEEHANFIERLKEDRKNYYWLVKKNEDDYIGCISLNRTDFRNRNTYLGLYSKPQNNIPGIGSILIELLKKVSFDIANLHTLKLEVIECNQQAINFYNKSGFGREGKLKEFVFKNGQWHDVIIMGLTSKMDI